MKKLLTALVLAVLTASATLSQEGIISGGTENPSVTSQETGVQQEVLPIATRQVADVSQAQQMGKMVLSGSVGVDVRGNVFVHNTDRSSSRSNRAQSNGISRAEARRIAQREAERIATQKAEVARVNARNHGHGIGNEAVRKANLVANKAVDKSTNYTDRKVSVLGDASAAALLWGKWGVGLAVLALLGVLGLLFFLLFRVLSGPERVYDPD